MKTGLCPASGSIKRHQHNDRMIPSDGRRTSGAIGTESFTEAESRFLPCDPCDDDKSSIKFLMAVSKLLPDVSNTLCTSCKEGKKYRIIKNK